MSKFKINTSLVVDGDFDVKGTTSTVNTETLTVKDNLIMVQGENQAMTGIIADNGTVSKTLSLEGYIFDKSITPSFTNLTGSLNFYSLWCYDTKLYENYYGTLTIDPNTKSISFEYMVQGSHHGSTMYYTINIYKNGVWKSDIENFEIGSLGKTSTDLTEIENIYEFFNLIKLSGECTLSDAKKIAYASPVLVGDTLKIGEGTATKDINGNITNFTFDADAAQALATRADSIENEAVLSWDATNYTIVDSGKKVSDILTQANFLYDEKTKTLNITFKK